MGFRTCPKCNHKYPLFPRREYPNYWKVDGFKCKSCSELLTHHRTWANLCLFFTYILIFPGVYLLAETLNDIHFVFTMLIVFPIAIILSLIVLASGIIPYVIVKKDS